MSLKRIKCTFCSSSHLFNGENIIRFSCGHEYCQNCLFHFFFLDIYSLLQDYVTNDLITLSCPICQEGLLQKSGNILFDLFESNYIKIKQKNNNQKLNSKKNNFKKLNKCRKHQLLADIYCEQCSTFFCKKCLNIHDEIGNGHHSLNKQTNPASLNSEENIFKFNCMIHEEEKICFFCEKCHELICNICFNNIHKEHKVSKINIFVKKALKNILNYRESNFNDAMYKLTEKKNNFEEKFQEDYQMTMLQLDKIIAYFQQIKQDYMDKMDDLYRKQNELNDLLLLSYNIINEEIKNLNSYNKTNGIKMDFNELNNTNNINNNLNNNLFNIFFLNEIANSKNGDINNKECNFMLNSINNCFLNTQINNKLDISEKSINEDNNLLNLIKENSLKNENKTKKEEEKYVHNKEEINMNEEEEEEEIINIIEQNRNEQEIIDSKNNNSYSNNSNNDNLLPVQMSFMEKLKGYNLTGNSQKIIFKGSINVNISNINIKDNSNNINNISNLLPNIQSYKIIFISNKDNKNNDFSWCSDNSLNKILKSNDIRDNKKLNELIISENEIAKISKDQCNIEIYHENNNKPYQKLNGHDAKINSIILIKYKTFCTASDDCKIKLWELINNITEEKYYCKQTLKEHKKEVNEIIFINKKLISCSNDNTIKIWDYDKDLGMTYVQTLNQHQNNVISLLQLDNKVFVSSDKSFSLNVWEFENIQKEEEKNK